MIIGHFDGASRSNPGEAGAGAAVADGGALTGLLNVGDIVHKTVFLGAL